MLGLSQFPTAQNDLSWFCPPNHLEAASRPIPTTYTFPFSSSAFPATLHVGDKQCCLMLKQCLNSLINTQEKRNTVCSVCLRPAVCFRFDPVSFGTGGRGEIEASQEIIHGSFQAVPAMCAWIVITCLGSYIHQTEWFVLKQEDK